MGREAVGLDLGLRSGLGVPRASFGRGGMARESEGRGWPGTFVLTAVLVSMKFSLL